MGERLKTLATCGGDHDFPRRVVCPILLSRSAIFCRVSPLVPSASRPPVGDRRRLRRQPGCEPTQPPLQRPSCRPAVDPPARLQCPGRAEPSFTPLAFAAARAALVRLGDRFRFVLGDGGQDVDGQLVGVGVVAADEVDARLHQGGRERHAPGQPVQLRHHPAWPFDRRAWARGTCQLGPGPSASRSPTSRYSATIVPP